MNLQELQTVVHHDMDIKIIWLNNDGYHSIRQTQYNLFNGEFVGINKESGLSFPSAEKIAGAYGIAYIRVDNNCNADEKIREALAMTGPVIIEAVLDSKQFFEPKLSSKVLPDGSIISPPLQDMYPFLDRDEYNRAILVEK
jgi:acetolactate synthase-1/2/3 large subunit